jgi:hypothetical protein
VFYAKNRTLAPASSAFERVCNTAATANNVACHISGDTLAVFIIRLGTVAAGNV